MGQPCARIASHGAIARVARTTPAESRKAMSSGMRVRNIQKPAVGAWLESYMNNMPASGASCLRSISPIVFCSGVTASSTSSRAVSRALTRRSAVESKAMTR